MAKYQVETEKGTLTLNGSTAAALASELKVKLNNPRANGYKINGNYGDNMFSVILVDKDRKPFKEYYLKKVGKTQDSQSSKLWQIQLENKKTKRLEKTFFCFAENRAEANNKAKKALKMVGGDYELAWTAHIATKGGGQAEQYLKTNIKVIDKSPLSFMDSVVRAFRDRVEILGFKNPLNKSYYQGKITYELIGKGKRTIKFITTANNESDFKRQAEIHLQHKHNQGEYRLLNITEIKKADISQKRREIIEK